MTAFGRLMRLAVHAWGGRHGDVQPPAEASAALSRWLQGALPRLSGRRPLLPVLVPAGQHDAQQCAGIADNTKPVTDQLSAAFSWLHCLDFSDPSFTLH